MADTATPIPQEAPFVTPQALQPFPLIALSALALALALLTPQGAWSLSLVGAGAGLAAASVILQTIHVREALRRLQLRRGFRALVVTDPDAAVMTSEDGRILVANKLATTLFGGIAGQTITGLLEAEFARGGETAARMTRAALAQGSAVDRLRLRDRTLEVSVQAVPGQDLIWRLRESAAPSRSDLADMPVPVTGRNGAGHLVWTNAAADRVLSASALSGQNVADTEISAAMGASAVPVRLGQDGDVVYSAFLASADDARGQDAATVLATSSDLVSGLPVPILTITVDGRILAANPPARDLLALPEAGWPQLYDLVEGMGRPISEWLADAGEGRGLLKSEFVRATLPGKELYLQITLGRVRDQNGVRLIGILNDATELKTLEAQFVQSQKMQAIGQLAGGVAHDFNNLLTAISGHCDLLLLRHDAGDPDYSDLMQIAQNANRAAALVGQLLAFSRKQTMKPQALDLRDTMSELTHLLNRLIGEKVKLDLKVAHTDRIIRADRRQFEQVIMNLVVNARDAMPNGGRIVIGVEEIHLSETLERDRAELPPGDYVLVRVSDEGVGIDPDKLPKIFEPFFTTKRTGEGTGLGLSTVYGIVKQTGGYIFAESTVGRGSTFSLYFPAHVRKQEAPVEPAPIEKPSLGGRGAGVILLVEDEAPVRAFASRALRMRGYTVLEAESAEAALETLEKPGLEVDVFVTDVIMPGLDGPTWVRKALETRPDTKVVFMSGYAEEGLAENQARVPNSVFLPKPFSLTDLTSTVHRQMS